MEEPGVLAQRHRIWAPTLTSLLFFPSTVNRVPFSQLSWALPLPPNRTAHLSSLSYLLILSPLGPVTLAILPAVTPFRFPPPYFRQEPSLLNELQSFSPRAASRFKLLTAPHSRLRFSFLGSEFFFFGDGDHNDLGLAGACG